MKLLGMLAGAGLALWAVPARASEAQAACVIAAPVNGDLARHAAAFFPKASNADLDALAACLGDHNPAIRDDFAFTCGPKGSAASI